MRLVMRRYHSSMTNVKLPAWVGKLTQKDLKVREAEGLVADSGGWRRWKDGKSRRVPGGRIPFATAVEIVRREKEGLTAVVAIRPGSMRSLLAEYEAWLTDRFKAGTIEATTFSNYTTYLADFLEVTGTATRPSDIGPEHFTAYMQRYSDKATTTRNRRVVAVKAFWRWCHKNGKAPLPLFGSDFKSSTIANVAGVRERALTPEQLALVCSQVADDPLLLAGFLLGLTCAFTRMDIARLPSVAVDLDRGVVDYSRAKVKRFGISRMNVLLPEVVAALRAYKRPKPKTDADGELFFLSHTGTSLYRDHLDAEGLPTGTQSNLFTRRWSEAVSFPFKLLRKTFATGLDDWPDQSVIDLMMGHNGAGSSGNKSVRKVHYVTTISESRLRPAVERLWLQAGGPSWNLPVQSRLSTALSQQRH
jgi:integrase